MNLFKLAIPAFIFTLISENVCFSNDEVNDRHRVFDFKEEGKRDFLPHTFWKQPAKDIIAYLEPQILETKLYNHTSYLRRLENPPEGWPEKDTFEENHFLELIYGRISEFMQDKSEPMPAFKEFKASLEHIEDQGDRIVRYSNVLHWIYEFIRPIALKEFEKKYGYKPSRIICTTFCETHLPPILLDKE